MKLKNVWLVIGLVAMMSVVVGADMVTQTTTRAPKSKMPAGVVTTEATVQAVVESINYESLSLTLKNMAGEITFMTVGPEVKRFREIKKGDTVSVNYMVSTAISLEKAAAGQTPTRASGDAMVRGTGAKPSAVVATTERITAEVMGVDTAARTVTLKGPDGNVVTINVPDSVKRLNEVKVGDFVVTERTIAVAIDVHKI